VVERAPFPFIVGSVRSGTTLLRLMLDVHPELAVPPESYFPRRLWRRRAEYERATNEARYGVDGDAIVDDLLNDPALHHFRDNWGLDPVVVRDGLRDLEATEFADVLRRLYELWARSQGKTRYGDKTPVYVLAIDELAGVFPEARFVHVIRDGRDVALSLLELAHPDHPRTAGQIARQWTDWVHAGRAAGERIGAHRYLEVRYEALVAQPEPELRRICDFIALDFDPIMLHPEARGLSAVPAHEHWQHANVDRPPTAGLRDWRTGMAPRDLARFEAIAGAELAAAGYERAVPHLPATARLAARAVTRRAAVRRAVARARDSRA
jgi:hypothetical protein